MGNCMNKLDHIFRPRSIAVIGASSNHAKMGWAIMNNLIKFGFKGPVYPVNPRSKYVNSIQAYASVTDIPGPVDLAIVVIPAKYVKDLFLECAKKGVKGLVVITAGFKEIGGEGKKLERDIVTIARDNDMRFIGPNCLGIINTDPEVSMGATFAQSEVIPGKIAFMSQSGAMGVAILDHAKDVDIGLSKFVSLGNMANVSGNDLIRDFGDDPNTDLILMYMENFGDPRTLIRLARDISMRKPIIAVKSGRTKAGALAASSHTGSLAGMDAAAEALFKQCGIMRATTIEELFDYALAFAHQPPLKGDNIAILTNSGGPAIMAVDAVEGIGLEIARFDKETEEAMKAILPKEASVRNPVDMIAGATPENYKKCLQILDNDKNVDGLLVINTPISEELGINIAKAIAAGSVDVKKPLVACMLGKKENSPGVEHLEDAKVPTYRFPESAVKALRMLHNYGKWLKKDKGDVKQFKVDRETAIAQINSAREAGRQWLNQKEARTLLQAYGFTTSKIMLAKSEEEAVKNAQEIGFPVVMKIDSRDIIHKWDSGGVMLDLHDEDEVREAYSQILYNVEEKVPGARVNGILIEQMIDKGKEVILGGSIDKTYGHMLMYGMGGIYVEAFKDVSFRLLPMTDADALEMIDETKGSVLFKGLRGEKPADVKVLQEWILRLAQLINEMGDVSEIDMNPVMVLPEGEGCIVVDTRIKLIGMEDIIRKE